MYFVIDIGSNTIRAVIFRHENSRLIPVLNKKYSAGLVNYIESEGALSREGIEVCVEALSELRIIMDAFSFDGIYAFATASLRNITNTVEVVGEIQKRCGISVRVLSGKEEAFFDYYGSMHQTEKEPGLLIDIGGGSTELVLYGEERPIAAESLRMGSLNMYNRHVRGIMPTKGELKAIQWEARKNFLHMSSMNQKQNIRAVKTITAVGGSARALLKLYRGMQGKEKACASYPSKYLKSLISMKWEEKQIAGCILRYAPERIHTLLPGAAILCAAAEFYEAQIITTSWYGVREGYLHYILDQEGKQHV